MKILIALLVLSGFSYGQSTFHITGTAKGFPEHTLLYLDEFTSAHETAHRDSTYITNQHFEFAGAITGVQRMMIRTADFSDYKYFWINSGPISFTAEKGKFRQAAIIGSTAQAEEEELNASIAVTGNDKQACISFIQQHPGSIVSADILSIMATTWGRDTAQMLYKLLTDDMKNTSYGTTVADYISLSKKLKVGDHYIDFDQPDLDGRAVRLSDYKDKVVLVEFWGSWCGPCRARHPELLTIYNEFKPLGFDILGVAADGNKKVLQEAIQKDALTWTNVSDLRGDKNKAALMYDVSYYPTSFLIDRNGVIIAKDLESTELRTRLTELLKK